jgi:hypothetical protein
VADFGDRRVMACTPGDLKRWLGEFCAAPGLAEPGVHKPTVTGAGSGSLPDPVVRPAASLFPHTPFGAVTVDAEGVEITLRWRVLEPRRIALLRIEQLELEFSYPAHAAAQARDWISRFDRHTQRGGG